MGRKRNQGRARNAAKAKAKQEAEEKNNLTATNEEPLEDHLITAHTRQLQSRRGNVLPMPGHDTAMQCAHGFEIRGKKNIVDFIEALSKEFDEASHKGDMVSSLFEAKNATMDEFAEVWNDSTKLKSVMSFILFSGTQDILEGDYYNARKAATFARCLEQWTAVYMQKTQPLNNEPKIYETYYADMHSLVKFFRHRIHCSCLDEKYEEVKTITKMGLCYNPECKFPGGYVERSKTMYCSRCRNVTYCSRECQEADWKTHKPDCDCNAEIIAKFEATQLK